jgi:hypothetical protein
MAFMDENIISDITSGWRTPINLSLTKKINISAFFKACSIVHT